MEFIPIELIEKINSFKQIRETYHNEYPAYAYQMELLQKIKKFLKKHHIEFLSDTYTGLLNKYNFKCQCGHAWTEPYTTTLQRFKRANYICKQCKK
jgi:hypothetical protein